MSLPDDDAPGATEDAPLDLLRRLPPASRDDQANPRAYGLTAFITPVADDARAQTRAPVYVVQGVWRDGAWHKLEGPDQLENVQHLPHLLGSGLSLSRRIRLSRRNLTILATVTLLSCWSVAGVWGSGILRHHRHVQSLQEQRDQIQQLANARLAAAAQREATITQALRREAELRAHSQQQVQAIETQRQLDNLGRDALAMILRGESERADQQLESALTHLRQRGELRGEALLLVAAGAAHMQKADHAAAERHLTRALSTLQKLTPTDTALLSDTHTHLATACRAQGRHADAVQHLRALLTLREESWGGYDLRLIPILQDLALTTFDLGQFRAVESICARIQSIRWTHDSAASPQAVDELSLLALTLVRQGAFDEAAGVCKRLVLIEPALDSRQRLRLRDALMQLAHLYLEHGHHSQGMILLERALNLDDPGSVDSSDWRLLARLYMRERRYTQAERIYQKLIESREAAAGSDDPMVADDASALAELYEQQGRLGEAEALYKLAMTIRERVLGPYHLDVARCAIHLADLYRVQNRTAQSEALYELAREIRRKSTEENPH